MQTPSGVPAQPSTRQEVIPPSARAGVLQEALVSTLGSNDFPGYALAARELESVYFDQASSEMDSGRFSDAANLLGLAAQVARDSAAVLEDGLADSPEDLDRLRERIVETRAHGDMLEGLSHFAGWLASIVGGRLPEALSAAGRSREAFAKAIAHGSTRKNAQFFQQMVSAFEQMTRAMDALRRLEFAAASMLAQRAQALIEGLATEPADDEDTDQHALIRLMLDNVEALFAKVTYRSRRAGSDHKGALYHAERACALIERQIENLPSFAPPWARAFVRLELGVVQAECAQIAATVAQDEHRWEDAMTLYEEARLRLFAAARTALDLPIASAPLIQESLMTQATGLEATIGRCLAQRAMWRENQALRAELDSLRRAVIDGLKGAGVTVTTSAEAASSVEQTTMIVNRLEAEIRSTASNLEAAINDSNLDAQLRASLLEVVRDISSSEDQGVSFLAHAKRAARVIAGTMQKIGESAANVAIANLTDTLLRLVGISP